MYTTPSPLDRIPDLETVPPEDVKALEDRLRPKLKAARKQGAADYHEGRERLRNVILD